LNASRWLPKQGFLEGKPIIKPSDFETYLKLRNIEGITEEWQLQCKKILDKYLEYVNWTTDEDKTLDYLQMLKDGHPVVYWRKKVLQIRRFLQYLKIEWADNINVPPEPRNNIPKRITKQDINEIFSLFKTHKYWKQIKAIILLGCSSGLRAEELYQLQVSDLDLINRIVQVNHNPSNGQTTKTGRSRISFFTKEASEALADYFEFYNNGNGLIELFGQSHLMRIFRGSSIRVKDFRKFFSQEWERNCGPTGAKKLLMGHSGDVDLNHYNAQSNEDLKKIYDNVAIHISEK
jgi:integrase